MYGFVYKIGWTEYNKWYIGSRHRNGCSISDLWSTYFTSSDDVKHFSMNTGRPDVIVLLKELDSTRKKILAEEEVFIKEYDAYTSENFFNKRRNAVKLDTEKLETFIQNNQIIKPVHTIVKELGVSHYKVKQYLTAHNITNPFKIPSNSTPQHIVDSILSDIECGKLAYGQASLLARKYYTTPQTVTNIVNRKFASIRYENKKCQTEI